MPLVIDTYSDYFFYLQYRRRAVPATVQANKLALQYFSLLYGHTDTKKLQPTHMVRFHEFLLNRKRLQRNNKGEYEYLSKYSVYKIMVKLRAYTQWLKNEGMLWDLDVIDVPVGDVPRPIPKYLTKEELKVIFDYLDKRVTQISSSSHKQELYNAYLYRALIRFLYTTGLRNAELRTLRLQDINLDELIGAVMGKGNKYAAITFSETARQYVQEYHEIRWRLFPGVQFEYVFTPYTNQANRTLTEQGLSCMVKMIGAKAGITKSANTHIYRHTLATHLAQAGYPVVQIRDKLRHSSISVTNVYMHSSPFELRHLSRNIDSIVQPEHVG